MATKNEQGYYTGSSLTGQQSRSNLAQGLRDLPGQFPLGAQRKNIQIGNPYLGQVKAIDKELKRLNDLATKALKGSDNKNRDLKILNAQLRNSGQLKRNTLGIDRRFWSRRTLQDQMRALQSRRDELTDFLGKEDVKLGDIVPTIKGFTPTFVKDLDSPGAVSKINSYYNPYFNKAKRKRDQNIYDTTRSDMLGGTDTTGMSEKQIDQLVQEQLPEGNMYRRDSKFYIGNVNEYGERKKGVSVGDEKDNVNNTIPASSRQNKSLGINPVTDDDFSKLDYSDVLRLKRSGMQYNRGGLAFKLNRRKLQLESEFAGD